MPGFIGPKGPEFAPNIDFFLRITNPDTNPGYLRDVLNMRRTHPEEQSLPADILFARALAEAGANFVEATQNRLGHSIIFPKGMGYTKPSLGYDQLDSGMQKLIDQAYAAIIFGISVESMHDMLTNHSTNAEFSDGFAYFSRKKFMDRLNEVMKGKIPVKLDIEKVLPRFSGAVYDPETGSELVDATKINRFRRFVEANGTYTFLIPGYEPTLPKSLSALISSNERLKNLILVAPSIEGSLRRNYHDRSVAALKFDEQDRWLASVGGELDPQRPSEPVQGLTRVDDLFSKALGDINLDPDQQEDN